MKRIIRKLSTLNNKGMSTGEALAFLSGLLIIVIVFTIVFKHQCADVMNNIAMKYSTLK